MANISFRQIFQYWLGVIACIFCFQPKLIVPGILGLLILVIVGYRKKQIVFQWSKPLIFLVLLYLVYLAGILFTNHLDIALKYAEYKMSLVIFPALLSVRFKEKLELTPVVTGLVAGLLIASFLGLINSYDIYLQTHDFNNAFGSSLFSYIHHPSYFSVFLTIGLAAIWYGYFQDWKGYRLIPVLAVSMYFMVLQLFCFSFAGMLFLTLLGFIVLLVWIFKRFGKIVFLVFVVLLPAIPFLVYKNYVHIYNTVNEMIAAVGEYAKDPSGFVEKKKDAVAGNDVRLIMWTVSTQEFATHPMGVGTGNLDDHLSYRLAKYGQYEMAKQDEKHSIRYNPHNQYLQTGLETGIIGLVIFVLILASSIVFAWKNKNWILLILAANLAFNSIFESMLQRESGIVFYTFWICVLVLYSNSRNRVPIPESSVD